MQYSRASSEPHKWLGRAFRLSTGPTTPDRRQMSPEEPTRRLQASSNALLTPSMASFYGLLSPSSSTLLSEKNLHPIPVQLPTIAKWLRAYPSLRHPTLSFHPGLKRKEEGEGRKSMSGTNCHGPVRGGAGLGLRLLQGTGLFWRDR